MYMVLDLVMGGTVMDRILEVDHFTEAHAAAVTADVLRAVQYLHSMGVVHRDLKPENLLYVSKDPNSPDYHTIKVADFGLAKVINAASAHSMKTTCGTPGYVAPEIIEIAEAQKKSKGKDAKSKDKDAGYGPEVDLWSLGVILYIMQCGYPPFYSESTPELFRMIKTGKYSFPEEYWKGVSEEAKDLVSNMLVVDPKKRFTAEQCLEHAWIRTGGKPKLQKQSTLHKNHRAFHLIRKLPIFSNIDPACLQRITSVLKVVRFSKGECIIAAGEIGDSMYFISAGSVYVKVDGTVVDELSLGDFFGEIALTVSKQVLVITCRHLFHFARAHSNRSPA
jgi:serine/threonine protein kinase